MARIMVCDDSKFMRLVLKKILTQAGHDIVAEAEDGAEAIEKYRAHKPDLVTMDITMPVMDGVAAVKKIHDEDVLARIVMVSAIGQQQIVTEAVLAGARDFIVKPFQEEKVVATIEKILAG